MRVLLIEDDRALARSIELMLKAAGFNVEMVDLGEDGVDLGKHYEYDMILLDLSLPDISGFDVMELLKQDPFSATIPVIAVTACVHAEEQHLAKDKGFHGYMTKPVDMNAMLSIVNSFAGAGQDVSSHHGIKL